MATSAHARGFSAFSALVWSAFLAVAIYLFAWPAIQGFLAVHTWAATPAYLPANDTTLRYYFTFKGKNYYCPRMTLWQVYQMGPVVSAADSAHDPNTTCYVEEGPPGTAKMAVLYPQAVPTFSLMLDRFGIAFMVFVVALVLDLKTRHARRKAAAAAAIASASGDAP